MIAFEPPYTILVYKNRKVDSKVSIRTKEELEEYREEMVKHNVYYVVVSDGPQEVKQITDNSGTGTGSES